MGDGQMNKLPCQTDIAQLRYDAQDVPPVPYDLMEIHIPRLVDAVLEGEKLNWCFETFIDYADCHDELIYQLSTQDVYIRQLVSDKDALAIGIAFISAIERKVKDTITDALKGYECMPRGYEHLLLDDTN